MVSQDNVGQPMETMGGMDRGEGIVSNLPKVQPRQAYLVVDHVSFVRKCIILQHGGECITTQLFGGAHIQVEVD